MASGSVASLDAWVVSTVSFSDACSKASLHEYIGQALDSMHSNIGSYASDSVTNDAIDTLTPQGGSGPQFYITVGKLANNYYGGHLYGYYARRSHIAFRNNNGEFGVRVF